MFRCMTGSVLCRVEQVSSAKPAQVYDVLLDVERWSDWMPSVSAASWERRGEPDTQTGGIRRMRFGLIVIRDRIVDGTRPHHQAYAASFPWYLPLKDYRGDIRIEDDPNGCRIIWTVTCASSRIPGLERSLKSSYTRLAAALAHEADSVAPS